MKSALSCLLYDVPVYILLMSVSCVSLQQAWQDTWKMLQEAECSQAEAGQGVSHQEKPTGKQQAE